MTCPSLETLAGWILRESSPEDEKSLEEHLFDCDLCGARAEKLEALVRRLRTMLPAILTPERRRRLEETVSPLPMVSVSPGEHKTIEFGPGAEIGFWVLRAELGGVERLDFELLARDGSLLASFEDVPFDAERGEVVLGCQTHYRTMGFPDELLARVTAVDAAGRRPVAEYELDHFFHDPV